MIVSGRILIVLITAITAVAALFCIIGLATKGWISVGESGLFCDVCSKTTAALSVISFILLILTIISFILLMLNILKNLLQFVPIVLLFITTIFLLATFASFNNGIYGYSYNLMVVAHFFSYIALAAAAYWYGQNDPTSSTG